VPEQQHHGKASVEKWLGSNLYGTTLTADACQKFRDVQEEQPEQQQH